MAIKFKNNIVGHAEPCYLIAEIGINHNGDINIAKKLILQAKEAGFNVVKFQKRVPEICVPIEKRDEIRLTPWGKMSYFEYKKRIEFEQSEYDEIDNYCKNIGMEWTASAWDIKSIEFLIGYDIPFLKIPSDKVRDFKYLDAVRKTELPVILSSGGANISDIEKALEFFEINKLILMQCTSEYPTTSERLNLRAMLAMKDRFEVNVGLSSHHTSPVMSAMAAAYGACAIEIHVTLDRAMWGTDQAISIEKRGMEILCKSIREFEKALGNKEKVAYENEINTLSRTIKKE